MENTGDNTSLILSVLLSGLLKNNEIIDKLHLDQESINIINDILKNHPSILDNITNDLTKILNDGEINSNDIPSIILLLKDSYNLYVSTKELKITQKQVLEFIKNTMIILIESNILKTNEENKVMIVMLINTSICLLESQINLNKTVNCSFNCFKFKD